jgi:5-carboxymethyl-2-hydroxymuconate isomerase
VPHCIIEHSSTINGNDLLPLVFQGALNTSLFEDDGSDIKVRAQSFCDYQTGSTKSDFIHVVLKILSGRGASDKQKLSKLVLEQIFSLNFKNCSITVEVVDMDKSSYAKLVV